MSQIYKKGFLYEEGFDGQFVIAVSLFLMSDDKAIKGQYSVQLYTDDQFLGETYFTLK